MKLHRILLAALAVLPWAAEAGRVKLCGTVLLSPGATFSSGELTVTTVLEKVFADQSKSSTSTSTNLDPVSRRYCVEVDNSEAPEPQHYRFRATIGKTSAPAAEFHTGNFTAWDESAGEASLNLTPGGDYDYYLDIIYLGAADPLERKLFLPGLRTFASAADAENNALVYDTHADLNKVAAVTYPDGTRISDGSFEISASRWILQGPMVSSAPVAIKPQHGSRAMIVNVPTTSSGRFLQSEAFEVKPSTPYTLSFYYKSPQIVGDIRPGMVTYIDRDGNEQAGSPLPASTAYAGNAEWTHFTQTFTTPAQAGFGRISLLEFSSSAPGAGVIAFDNVVLVEGNPPGLGEASASVGFFDGLNRPLQSMTQVGHTDIYSQTVYDEFGRSILGTLPIGFDYFRHNGRHAFLEGLYDGAYGGHLNYYYGSPDPADPSQSLDPNSPGPKAKGYPFTRTFYEASPLGRVSRSVMAGGDWRGTTPDLDHDIRSYYGSVTGGQVLLNDPAAAPLAVGIPTSEVGDHFLAITQGENGEVTRSFTDLFGRVTRQETKFGTRWIASRSEYDALGNIVQETPPPGPNNQIVSRTMEFNSLSQPLSESSLDVGTNKSIFDRKGLLRFTQSQTQRDRGAFTYLKYDDLDRLLEMGEYLSGDAFAPETVEDGGFPGAGDPLRKVRVVNTYDHIPTVHDVCNEDALGERILIAPPNQAVPPGYFPDLNTAYDEVQARLLARGTTPSALQFLQLSSLQGDIITPIPGSEFTALTLADNSTVGFDLVGLPTDPADLPSPYGEPFPFAVQWGPLKGKLTKTTVCNQALEETPVGLKEFSRYFNYDKFGNVTEVFEYNGYIQEASRQWQKSRSGYDVQNRLKVREYFADAASQTPALHFTYAYDAQGRLDHVQDGIGDVVVRNEYNLIGQLSTLTLGKTGPGQVRLNYKYHFRGWIQEISAENTAGTELYRQELKYEDGSLARFDGSISEYNYSLLPGELKRFTFGYDPMNRLTSARTMLTSPDLVDGGIWGYQYADNGAITRQSNLNQAFEYQYVQGNQLDHVIASGEPSTRDMSNPGTFVFDAGGRMVVDESRQMDLIYDDALDRPAVFHREEGGSTVSNYMVYDDQGNRLSKLEYEGANPSTAKHYTGFGKEIRFGAPGWQEVFPFEGYGRMTQDTTGAWVQEGYIQNHLGSTVKVHNLTDDAETYRTDYEPYGKLRLQTVSTSVGITPKYTGKEHDQGIELDYFGARYYDPDLGLWISPDPMGQFHSPYAYGPNPINGTDLDGNWFGDAPGTPGGSCIEGIDDDIPFWQGPSPNVLNSISERLFLTELVLRSDIRLGVGYTDGSEEVKLVAGTDLVGIQGKSSRGSLFMKAGVMGRLQYAYRNTTNPGVSFITAAEGDRQVPLGIYRWGKTTFKLSGSYGVRTNLRTLGMRPAGGIKATLPNGAFITIDFRGPSLNPNVESE